MDRAFTLFCGFWLIAAQTGTAAAQEQYVPGIWHFRSVACADTTVKSVQPRLTAQGETAFTAADFESGVQVVYNTRLGSDSVHPEMLASVTLYGGVPGAEVMTKERAGDRVQVCFISRPAPTVDCNPDLDVRGRVFRVYDFKQQKQYYGQNTEHGCGGA